MNNAIKQVPSAINGAGKNRIDVRFEALKKANKTGFMTFLTAGDPDYDTSLELLTKLPASGVDLIEIGMPFSDPMADGPAIQASSLRAIKGGQNLIKTLAMVKHFRTLDQTTPIILMGYYNPIYRFGVDRFLSEAILCGVDGLIVVDLPPEEDNELCVPANQAGVSFIRLVTPTSDAIRLPKILSLASGFLYYVSMAGITGSKIIEGDKVKHALARLRQATTLPIAVGFGIKTPDQAVEIAKFADAVVVGSALVEIIAQSLHDKIGKAEMISQVLKRVQALSDATHQAR